MTGSPGFCGLAISREGSVAGHLEGSRQWQTRGYPPSNEGEDATKGVIMARNNGPIKLSCLDNNGHVESWAQCHCCHGDDSDRVERTTESRARRQGQPLFSTVDSEKQSTVKWFDSFLHFWLP